ncbi:MAG: type II toxin-antitoxin system VapC family toxin [Verrucomicrobiae bacterium]|nr:type II toxin-antitoxin system VapC family toxin [Verrucomicrobiae bacterium]
MPRPEHLVAAVLDTHLWVWLAAGHNRAAPLAAFKGQWFLSAISVWEVLMLESKERLRLKPNPDQWLAANLAPPVVLEPLSPAICRESCRLPDFHGDPADRMIVATALVLGLPLATADARIRDWNNRFKIIQLVEF